MTNIIHINSDIVHNYSHLYKFGDMGQKYLPDTVNVGL